MELTPLKLHPAYKEYLWGGHRLRAAYHKEDAPEITAESWELAQRPEGVSVVEGGTLAGRTLDDLAALDREAFWGKNCADMREFPLLAKLIDARKDLSIQVHPSDETALRDRGEAGKAEMWYIVDCDENAGIYFGFAREITAEEFRRRAEDGTICEVLNRVPVKKGDAFFILPGTIHAICAGILVAEIQQNSDTTFRVYDYRRRGADGQPRPLHLDRAAAALYADGGAGLPAAGRHGPCGLDGDGAVRLRLLLCGAAGRGDPGGADLRRRLLPASAVRGGRGGRRPRRRPVSPAAGRLLLPARRIGRLRRGGPMPRAAEPGVTATDGCLSAAAICATLMVQQGGFSMDTKDMIRRLRTEKGLSQDELAEKLFVTRQAVSRWENGETTPNTETLKQLSRLFDVSINTLLGAPRQLVCQCCGMPLEDAATSREPDGTFNEEYCKWCYTDGTFKYTSKEQLIDFCVAHMASESWPAEQVRAHMETVVPNLKHWKK